VRRDSLGLEVIASRRCFYVMASSHDPQSNGKATQLQVNGGERSFAALRMTRLKAAALKAKQKQRQRQRQRLPGLALKMQDPPLRAERQR
jgi:hypothetical protein